MILRPAISATRLITMTALLVIGAIALAALVVGLVDGARGGTVGDLVAAGSGAVVLALVALPSWRIGMLSRRGGAFRRQLVRITMCVRRLKVGSCTLLMMRTLTSFRTVESSDVICR